MFSISTFHELLKGLPRQRFNGMVKKRNADKYAKKFGHWQHLIAMMYAQLSGASSLRTLAVGFNSHQAHHYHLDATPIKRSTLADANNRRSAEVFNDTASWLIYSGPRI